tara:strand:+ start:386 stop:994 length:609 start_codon:yes stop_codon:yes gene_type:complete
MSVLVVYGGAPVEQIEVSGCYKAGARGPAYALVDMPLENYDYHALSALSILREHPFASSNAYVYLLETTKVKREFYALSSKAAILAEQFPSSVLSGPLPNANIVVFGSKVISNMSGRYDVPMTKEEATLLEMGRGASKRLIDLCRRSPIETVSLGVWMHMPQRQWLGKKNVYNTGVARMILYYPWLGVTKYVNWNHENETYS